MQSNNAPLWLTPRSVQIHKLDGEILFCNDYTWMERKTTDSAIGSNITLVLSLLAVLVLFF